MTFINVGRGLIKHGHSARLLIRKFNYKQTFQTRFTALMEGENYHKHYQRNESKDQTSTSIWSLIEFQILIIIN